MIVKDFPVYVDAMKMFHKGVYMLDALDSQFFRDGEYPINYDDFENDCIKYNCIPKFEDIEGDTANIEAAFSLLAEENHIIEYISISVDDVKFTQEVFENYVLYYFTFKFDTEKFIKELIRRNKL